jgi:flagellar biosynthesis/type III secretory pathway M-ring protein FliF/YscJ
MAYTRQPAARSRPSVAVLIDNLRTTAEDASPRRHCRRISSRAHRAGARRRRLRCRGDTVNVVNSSFRGETPEVAGEVESSRWESPAQNLKTSPALVLVIIIFSVLKPLTRGLLNAARTPLRPALAGAGAGAPPEAPAIAYEQQIAQARGLVAQDPKRGEQVVKSWVSNDE